MWFRWLARRFCECFNVACSATRLMARYDSLDGSTWPTQQLAWWLDMAHWQLDRRLGWPHVVRGRRRCLQAQKLPRVACQPVLDLKGDEDITIACMPSLYCMAVPTMYFFYLFVAGLHYSVDHISLINEPWFLSLSVTKASCMHPCSVTLANWILSNVKGDDRHHATLLKNARHEKSSRRLGQ